VLVLVSLCSIFVQATKLNTCYNFIINQQVHFSLTCMAIILINEDIQTQSTYNIFYLVKWLHVSAPHLDHQQAILQPKSGKINNCE
jgi:hypothetical protein